MKLFLYGVGYYCARGSTGTVVLFVPTQHFIKCTAYSEYYGSTGGVYPSNIDGVVALSGQIERI